MVDLFWRQYLFFWESVRGIYLSAEQFDFLAMGSWVNYWLLLHVKRTIGLLFCTLISENQGLEKLRSVLNLRKISGPAHLIFFSVDLSFFSVCHLNFFQILYHKHEKNSGDKLKKNSGLLKKIQVY